jgi:hypothetical protein
MLTTDKLPRKHLGKFTEQINNWLGDMIRTRQLPPPKNGVEKYELGEQFLMVSMQDPEVKVETSPGEDLARMVERTGRRHHQLKYGAEPVAYARSLVDEDETLCQLFATKLAPSVGAAITWLDEHEDQFEKGSWLVRLVSIPTFHTHVFLIQNMENGSDEPELDSKILVVSRPPWMEDTLPKEELLTSSKFLLGFKGKKPILGLGEQREQF